MWGVSSASWAHMWFFQLQYFGLKDSDLPAIVVQDKDGNRKFVNQNIKASEMSDWLQDFLVKCLHETSLIFWKHVDCIPLLF